MARKGENIYKRKDGRWEGRYVKSRTPEGKIRYGYIYAATHKEAKEKLARATVFHEMHPAEKTDSGCTTLFQEVAVEWLESISPKIKESTNNKYRNLLESYIYPEFKTVPLCNMTHETIEAYCNRLLQTGGAKGLGLSPKTVSDVLSIIRSILHFAVRKGESIPCGTGTIQIKRSSREMRVLSRSEQEKLCRYLYSDLDGCNMGILLSLFTGLRIGEVCALRWEDISLSEKTIHIHQTMQRIQVRTEAQRKTKIVITTPKSPCSVRTIPIPDRLAGIMEEHQESPAGYFLTNSNSRYIEPRTLQNHFKNALDKSSVESANYHSLRHTFATRCVELGFDVKSLSEILGHASVSITMNRYVHPSMELKKENMQRLSELFSVK